MFQSLGSTVDKMRRLIARLRNLEEKHSLNREPADLRWLVYDTVGMITSGEVKVAAAQSVFSRIDADEIQKVINAWVPRGVEMFGNERGGQTAITFGFKDRNNGTAQGEWYNEVREVLELVNVEIARTKISDISAPDARSLVREVQDTGESLQGVRPEDLLRIPDPRFFRRRGMEEVVFMPYDVYGNFITEDGKPVGSEQYLGYLKSVLPEYYVATREFAKYRDALLARESPEPGSSYGW